MQNGSTLHCKVTVVRCCSAPFPQGHIRGVVGVVLAPLLTWLQCVPAHLLDTDRGTCEDFTHRCGTSEPALVLCCRPQRRQPALVLGNQSACALAIHSWDCSQGPTEVYSKSRAGLLTERANANQECNRPVDSTEALPSRGGHCLA
jgi:hypothetical protein